MTNWEDIEKDIIAEMNGTASKERTISKYRDTLKIFWFLRSQGASNIESLLTARIIELEKDIEDANR